MTTLGASDRCCTWVPVLATKTAVPLLSQCVVVCSKFPEHPSRLTTNPSLPSVSWLSCRLHSNNGGIFPVCHWTVGCIVQWVCVWCWVTWGVLQNLCSWTRTHCLMISCRVRMYARIFCNAVLTWVADLSCKGSAKGYCEWRSMAVKAMHPSMDQTSTASRNAGPTRGWMRIMGWASLFNFPSWQTWHPLTNWAICFTIPFQQTRGFKMATILSWPGWTHLCLYRLTRVCLGINLLTDGFRREVSVHNIVVLEQLGIQLRPSERFFLEETHLNFRSKRCISWDQWLIILLRVCASRKRLRGCDHNEVSQDNPWWTPWSVQQPL